MDLKTLHKVSYGMYVVSSRLGDKTNGQIANTVFQISSEPATIAVSINKQNLTHQYISESNLFGVSVLVESVPMSIIGDFGFKSGRDYEKFAQVKYVLGVTGVPLLTDHVAGHLEAEVIGQLDGGTHTVFVGKLVSATSMQTTESPMTYAYYHTVKRGTAPKTAPTYIKEETTQKAALPRYKCPICGYVYDPELGDPAGQVPTGTLFEQLPAGWECPICGAPKDAFEPIKE